MSNRNNRKINKTTVKGMSSLSHYKFQCRLQHKAKQYGTNIIVATEEYTSKTCGKCGEIDEKLGSKKVFNCKKCKYKIDRDYNGARNLLISVCTKLSGK